ncbi:MAG: alpha/beta fold hydrolase [Ktedonobacterales bacterium]
MSLHLSAHRIRRGTLIVAACLALLTLSILPGQSASASSATPHASPPKPSIVLVHGAWADGSSWSKVIQDLQGKGYTVYAPPNPLRGLTGDSAYIASFLKTVPGPIILVGHSYGGAVITNAARGNPNVKALVYVDAFIPDQGENVFQLDAARPGSCLGGDPTHVFNFVPYPGAPAGDFDLYLKTAPDAPYPGFAACFANDLPASTAAVLAATQRPLTLLGGQQPSGAPAWKTIASWAVIGTADHVIPPAELLFMAQRAHAHIVEVKASHLSMISQPGVVVNTIVAAANAAK